MVHNKKQKTLLNQSLVDRIDSMKEDRDYSPYAAQRKQTIGVDDAFDENAYYTDEELEQFSENNEKDSSNSSVVIITIIVILAVLGAGAYFVLNMMK